MVTWRVVVMVQVTKDHPEGAFYRLNLDGKEELSPCLHLRRCVHHNHT